MDRVLGSVVQYILDLFFCIQNFLIKGVLKCNVVRLLRIVEKMKYVISVFLIK